MEKYKQLIKIAKYNNALTWDYTNKQGGARENPGNPLQSARCGVLWLSLLTRERPWKGARPSRRAAAQSRRGAGKPDFFKKGLDGKAAGE